MNPLEQEAELVRRLYARDEQALALFYQNYHQALYGFIWRVVQHRELAEDILQEGMLKFWLSFAAYDATKGRLFTWALNICRNLAIDSVREARYRAAKRTLSLVDEDTQRLLAPRSFVPEHIGVRDWLTALPSSDRELMEMLYFKGYTHLEAAEYLQLPLGTVKSRVKRIIRTLAQAINC